MPKKISSEASMDVYKAILQLKDVDECYRFFQDICSVSELRTIEQRFDVGLLLKEGCVYTDIVEKTGASSATISRVNRFIQFGTGAFNAVVERMKAVSGKAKKE